MAIDLMSPENTPGGAKKTPVKRINKFPLVIVTLIAVMFVAIISFIAMQRGQQQQAEMEKLNNKKDTAKTDAMKYAANLVSGYTAGSIIKPTQKPMPAGMPNADSKSDTPEKDKKALSSAEGSQIPELKVPVAHVSDDLENPPLPNSQSQNRVVQSAIERIQEKKLGMFEEAVMGKKTSVALEDTRRNSSQNGQVKFNPDQLNSLNEKQAMGLQGPQNDDPNVSYQAKLAKIKAAFHNTGDDSSFDPNALNLSQNQTSNAQRNDINQFNDTSGNDRWSLNSKVKPPKRFELRAGFVLPATLISGINSDLPGQIIAQVSQNVYDSATGKDLLIPQGTRLIGTYNADVMYGQRRVMIAYQRLVFPDAKAMDIGAMVGADQAGYSGFEDQVNNHYLRIFGSSLLMSFITAGVTYSQEKNQASTTYGAPRANDVLSEALGQQIGQAAAQMIQKNMNIAPTLEIRSGYRFNVMVNKDMDFPSPYRAFDYKI